MSIVISNSSPLIALASIGRLELLRNLWGEIVIPDAIYEEVVIKGHGKKGAETVREACNSWIKKTSVKNRSVVDVLLFNLDKGEAEVIALGQELGASLLIIDNREPRGYANNINLKVMGTLGIIKLAWIKGYVINPIKEIESLLVNGFWIDEKLMHRLYEDLKKG